MKSCMALLLSLTIALAGLSIGCGEKEKEKETPKKQVSPTTQKGGGTAKPAPTTRP